MAELNPFDSKWNFTAEKLAIARASKHGAIARGENGTSAVCSWNLPAIAALEITPL